MRPELSPRTLNLKDYQFSGKGKIYSFTTVYEAPERFKEFEPYVVALVDLEEGPRITTMLTDLEQEWVPDEIDGKKRMVMRYKVEIGMPVEMVTRRLWSDGKTGLLHHGYKFRPPLRRQEGQPSG